MSKDISSKSSLHLVPFDFLLSISHCEVHSSMSTSSPTTSPTKTGFHKRRRLKYSEAADDKAKGDENTLIQVSLEELTALFNSKWRQIFSFISPIDYKGNSSSAKLSLMLRSFSSLILSRLLHTIVQETASNVLLYKTQALLRSAHLEPKDIFAHMRPLRSCQQKLFSKGRLETWLSGPQDDRSLSNFSFFVAISMVEGSSYDNQQLQVRTTVYLNESLTRAFVDGISSKRSVGEGSQLGQSPLALIPFIAFIAFVYLNSSSRRYG